MRSWSAVVVVVAGLSAGFSLFSCSDEDPGPGIGPDTSWQISCAPGDVGCGSSEDPHGPLGGPLDDIKTDDQKISVSCRFTGAGLQLRLEDPGAESNAANKVRARARSVLEIGNGVADDNKCIVTVTEYSRDGARKKLIESCAGNKLEPLGTCVLTGNKNEDDYAFNGTIQCNGMRVNNVGDPDYKLSKARAFDEPMQLQIRDCD